MGSLDHAMWSYQVHYRAGQRVAAARALHKLDARFKPDVFLVGILDSDAADRSPACVEPGSGYWVHSASFNHIRSRAAAIRASYPDMLQSHPLAQERADEAARRRSVRAAIVETIAVSPDKPLGVEFFVSLPERVGHYLVCVVLCVQAEVLASHHRLRAGEVQVDKYQTWPVSRSLIDATVTVLLTNAVAELQRPEPSFLSSERDAGDTLRSAARRLAMETAFRADPKAVLSVPEFFYTCNEISKLKYESKSAGASLLVARRGHPGQDSEVVFAEPIALQDHRRVRKLLELAPEGVSLHVNGGEVFGLARLRDCLDASEDLFEVRFLGLCHWELLHCGEVLMSVRFGEPSLPVPSFYEHTLRADLPRVFRGISNRAIQRIVELVNAADVAGHGVLLVVSDDAPGEAKRLAAEGTPIVPTRLTPSLLQALSRIDGAVLIDRQAKCHAIGVILDGIAMNAGNPARGARYNSALRYVETSWSRRTRCLAVVVSEDGGVSLVPDLRPAIRRADVDAAIDRLVAIRDSASVQAAIYSDVHEWLRQHQFYLLPEDCARVNACVATVEARLGRKQPTNLRSARDLFKPDPSMDPKFYYTDGYAGPRRPSGLTPAVDAHDRRSA